MSISTIKLNQCLHGYDQGHNLIQSSIQFKSETKRLLMMMTDMSGPNMQKGFEECITGYPLKETNMYALTKTWYAHEMKRPGCVWSHTLLIQFPDLAKLTNISLLISLFKRPSNDVEFEYYSKIIELNEESFVYENSIIELENLISPEFIKLTLKKIYENPNDSILIQTSSPEKYDSLILSIWLQQWPRLKRNFSFCTAAITPRLLNNKMLDLQVVSKKAERSLASINKILIQNDEFIIDEIDKCNLNNTNWISTSYNNLINPSYKFKSFLNHYGADISNERNAFISIVELYEYFKNLKNENIADVISTLAKYFPERSEGSLFKIAVLSQITQDQRFDFPVFSEEEILLELAKTENYSAFDYEKLEVTDRFKSLFKKSPDTVFNILNELLLTEINKGGELILESLSKEITQDQIDYLITKYQRLLFTLVFYNNEIAYSESFWKISPNRQKEVLNSLIKINSLDWQRVFDVLLTLNIELDNDIFKNISLDITKYVLNWLNKNQCSSISNSWYSYLKSRPFEFINWIKSCTIQNSIFYKLIPLVLNPNSQDLSNINSQVWIKALEKLKNVEFKSETLRFKAFVLAFTLNNPDKNTQNLLTYVFDQVYNAALNDNLDYECWKWIEIHTKPLALWQEWDKCKKLRNLIVDIFIEFNWKIGDLKLIIFDSDLRYELEKRYYKKK